MPSSKGAPWKKDWKTTQASCANPKCSKTFQARNGQHYCSDRCRNQVNNAAKHLRRNPNAGARAKKQCDACEGKGRFGTGWRTTACKKCKGRGKI